MKAMIRFGFMLLLLNAAGIALAVLGYLCVRDGHEWFAVTFMAMAYCTIAVPKGSFSLSASATSGKGGKDSSDEKDKGENNQ